MCFSQFRVYVVSGTISQNKSIRHRQIFSALQNEWLRVQKGSYTLEILSVEILTLKKKKKQKPQATSKGRRPTVLQKILLLLSNSRYQCRSLGGNKEPQFKKHPTSTAITK